MATLSPVPKPARRSHRANPVSRLLVRWHLLSLDAPTIAVLWTIFPARLSHIPLPLVTSVAMALAVWTLYAADRLLDTGHLTAHSIPSPDLEPRHLFHHRHRNAFLVCIAAAAALLAVLLPHLAPAAIRLYLTECALMAGYFLLIHATPPHRPRPIPKELLVGLFFAAATFIPAVSRAPSLRPKLLPDAFLFAALCTLNCLFIYAWEHPTRAHPHRLTRTVIRHLPAAAITLILLSVIPSRTPYPLACALSAAMLLALHHARHRLSRLILRAAADAALLTPILFLPFL